jgi:hypothetical protein
MHPTSIFDIRYSVFDIQKNLKEVTRTRLAPTALQSFDLTITEAKNVPAAASYRSANGTFNPARVSVHRQSYAQPKRSATRSTVQIDLGAFFFGNHDRSQLAL